LSEHPLAAAILASAVDRKVALQDVNDFASVTGKGVTGTIGGRRVAVGNAALLKDHGVVSADLEARADALRKEGATALFVAVDDTPAGIIAVADPIKATTMAALDALRGEGIRIVMLTGDNRTTAQAVAAKLGITEVEADVLPDQKNAIVRRLKREAVWSRWPEMASMMLQRWPRPMSVSRWARAPMSPCKAPASRSSKEISPESRAGEP